MFNHLSHDGVTLRCWSQHFNWFTASLHQAMRSIDRQLDGQMEREKWGSTVASKRLIWITIIIIVIKNIYLFKLAWISWWFSAWYSGLVGSESRSSWSMYVCWIPGDLCLCDSSQNTNFEAILSLFLLIQYRAQE